MTARFTRQPLALALAAALALAGCSPAAPESAPAETGTGDEDALVAKPLDEYTWAELSEISERIAAAPSDEEGRRIATEFGIVDADGRLTTATKMIVLDGTRALDVRVAGIRHDDRADGQGKAGITFMSVGALDLLPMNDEDTVEGGWEASSLRKRLAEEVPPRLDADLRDAIVLVRKLTNNVGRTDDVASVTATEDSIWVPSAHEVCGDVSWDSDEFRGKRGAQDIDGLVNAEGTQYEAFAQAGVTGSGDGSAFLSLEESTGATTWWYRTPYPFDWEGYGDTGTNGYFYRVMPSGYPESVGAPQDESGVVFGFCV